MAASNEESTPCFCNKSKKLSDEEELETVFKEKRNRLSFSSLTSNFCRTKSLPFSLKRSRKPSQPEGVEGGTVKKVLKWSFKSCLKKDRKPVAEEAAGTSAETCSCEQKTEDVDVNEIESIPLNAEEDNAEEAAQEEEPSTYEPEPEEENPVVVEEQESPEPEEQNQPENVPVARPHNINGIYGIGPAVPPFNVITAPFLDTHWIRAIHEDCDEAARLARAREIEQGVDPPPDYRPMKRVQLLCPDNEVAPENSKNQPPRRLQLMCPPDLSVDSLKSLFQNHVTLKSCPLDKITGCHTQVDFIHCLVPDLLAITNCSFYWGKMDRYEAERLLDGKSEGTFLLRDSAQEEFLFSVSFRKYGRSLHARIEQWNHKFSFDSHDPGVYTSDTVCGLIEHYKDPRSCMFFEPMLTSPLHRKKVFSLQHLARAAIVTRLAYDNISNLQLPKSLKTYLKEYHYRQKVRVERFDDDIQWIELRNAPS